MTVEVIRKKEGVEVATRLEERGDFVCLGNKRMVGRDGRRELVPVYAENPFEGEGGVIVFKHLWGNENQVIRPGRERKITLLGGEKATVRAS